jgi:isopentenyl-diphosphate delta-isomerase type 1
VTELFETFDDAGRPIGLVPRDRVHVLGLWHRSAHVFLFDPAGRLYVQQRSATKDLYPTRWDLSVGEHVQPGESYHAAAIRGLAEELGVTGVTLEPMGAPRAYRCDVPERGIADHELQQAFTGHHAGSVRPDAAEVAAVRVVSAAELGRWIAAAPDEFTPWLLHELRERQELGPFWLPVMLPDGLPANPNSHGSDIA